MFHAIQLGHYLELPANLDTWRTQLGGFGPPSITLAGKQLNELWPFLSNVWSLHNGLVSKKIPTARDPIVRKEYRCKYRRPLAASRSTGERIRASSSIPSCKCVTVVTIDYCGVDGVFSSAEDEAMCTVTFKGTHCHPLHTCDSDRVHDALQSAFKRYIEFGCNFDVTLANTRWRDDSASQALAKAAGLVKKVDYVTLNNWMKTLKPQSAINRSIGFGD
ncbi:hypothetical protein F4804DRAFT_271036 [Jackrogersella minutella]|nr:hypothetical protein F4804DRAFT_271036 [Jackrogersella minutella]